VADTPKLSLRDAQTCLEIVAECRELGADAGAWHAHLLNRLRALVGAQVAIGSNIKGFGQGRLEPISLKRIGWATESAEKLWTEYASEVPVEQTPEYPRLISFTGPIMTLSRDEIWEKGLWHRSAAFNERHKPAGVDDYIISLGRSPRQKIVHSVWLHRAVGEKPFTRREWWLIHLIHGQISGLIGGPLASAAEPSVADLSPRQLQTLDRLLRGDSEKQIATALKLSQATVHEYVTGLYRHFGVSSKGELMARFVGRAAPRLDS
jgi:DNA-binding CsgD family transcriptional regulator